MLLLLVSGKHNYVSLSTDPSAVVETDMHYINRCYKVLSVCDGAAISSWTSAYLQ